MIACSRTEPASRVERTRILLAYRDEPCFFAVGQALGLHHQTVRRCVEKAVVLGPLRALSDLPRPDKGDTTTLDPTLRQAGKNLSAARLGPTPEDPCDLVADKGYHSRDVLEGLDDDRWKTRVGAEQRLIALAWRRRGACGGLWQSQPVEVGRRQGSHARTRRHRRTQSRPCLGARRHASNVSDVLNPPVIIERRGR
jgi:hypothetical protein